MLWSSYILFTGTSFYHKCFYLDVNKDYWELWYLKVPKSMFKGLSHRVIIILWLILSASENTSFRKLKISDGLQNRTAYRKFQIRQVWYPLFITRYSKKKMFWVSDIPPLSSSFQTFPSCLCLPCHTRSGHGCSSRTELGAW